jgi:hypothetical protein
MRPRETFEQLVARVNATAFVPPPNPGERDVSAPKPRKRKEAMKTLGKKHVFPTTPAASFKSVHPFEKWFAECQKAIAAGHPGIQIDGGGVDFGKPNDKGEIKPEPAKMKNLLRKAAHKRGLSIKVALSEEGNGVAIAVTPATQAEVDTWKAEDATRKAAKKAKKAAKKAATPATAAA